MEKTAAVSEREHMCLGPVGTRPGRAPPSAGGSGRGRFGVQIARVERAGSGRPMLGRPAAARCDHASEALWGQQHRAGGREWEEEARAGVEGTDKQTERERERGSIPSRRR